MLASSIFIISYMTDYSQVMIAIINDYNVPQASQYTKTRTSDMFGRIPMREWIAHLDGQMSGRKSRSSLKNRSRMNTR